MSDAGNVKHITYLEESGRGDGPLMSLGHNSYFLLTIQFTTFCVFVLIKKGLQSKAKAKYTYYSVETRVEGARYTRHLRAFQILLWESREVKNGGRDLLGSGP